MAQRNTRPNVLLINSEQMVAALTGVYYNSSFLGRDR